MEKIEETNRVDGQEGIRGLRAVPGAISEPYRGVVRLKHVPVQAVEPGGQASPIAAGRAATTSVGLSDLHFSDLCVGHYSHF